MKYQVSLNGKQFEVEVEKGSVSAVPTGAAPAPAPAAAPAAIPTSAAVVKAATAAQAAVTMFTPTSLILNLARVIRMTPSPRPIRIRRSPSAA